MATSTLLKSLQRAKCFWIKVGGPREAGHDVFLGVELNRTAVA
jgi:hypothetical protein